MISILGAIDPATFAALAATILGAGGIGAFATYRKAGKEAENIAAQTLISVNEELRRELARRDEELDELRDDQAELRKAINSRDQEIFKLRMRLTSLEHEIRD